MYKRTQLLLHLIFASSLSCGVFEDFKAALNAEVATQIPGESVCVDFIARNYFENRQSISARLGQGCQFLTYPIYVVTPDSVPESTSPAHFAQIFLSKSAVIASRDKKKPFAALTLPEWRTVVFLKDEVSGKDAFFDEVIKIIGPKATCLDCVVCAPKVINAEVKALVARRKRYVLGYADERARQAFAIPSSNGALDKPVFGGKAKASLPGSGGLEQSGGASASPLNSFAKRVLCPVPSRFYDHFRDLHSMLVADDVQIAVAGEYWFSKGVVLKRHDYIEGGLLAKKPARMSIPIVGFKFIATEDKYPLRVIYTSVEVLLEKGFLDQLSICRGERISSRGCHTVIFFSDTAKRSFADQQSMRAAVDKLMVDYGITALHFESTVLDHALVERIAKRCSKVLQSPERAGEACFSGAGRASAAGPGAPSLLKLEPVFSEKVVVLGSAVAVDDEETEDDMSLKKSELRPARLKRVEACTDLKAEFDGDAVKRRRAVDVKIGAECVDLVTPVSTPLVDPALSVERSIMDACTQKGIELFKVENEAQLRAIPSRPKKIVWIPMSIFCVNAAMGTLKSADELAAGFVDDLKELRPQFKTAECRIIMFNDFGRELSPAEFGVFTLLRSKLGKATIHLNLKPAEQESAVSALLSAMYEL